MDAFLTAFRSITRQRGFMVLLGCCFLLGLAISFVGPFLSMFGTREVGMTAWQYGMFMTVTSLSAAAISTVLARWSDTRVTRRAMLILGCVFGLFGYLGYAFERDVVRLTVIGSLVLGVSSITFSQLFALAREMLPHWGVAAAETPLYINVFRMSFALAWTGGPAIAAWVMVHHSYRGTFLGAAACFGLLLVAVLAWVRNPPPRVQPVSRAGLLPGRSGADSSFKALVEPVVLAHFLAFVLVFTASTLCMINLPLLVLEDLGGNERQVGIVFSVAPFFELPLMFWLGLLASRGDQARLIRASVALAAVYYGAVSLVGVPWHIYPLQIMSAAVTAITGGVAITFFQNFLPTQPATATNLYMNAARIGGTSGYLLFHALVSAWGHRGVFVSAAGLSCAALGLMWIMRPRVAVRP